MSKKEELKKYFFSHRKTGKYEGWGYLKFSFSTKKQANKKDKNNLIRLCLSLRFETN